MELHLSLLYMAWPSNMNISENIQPPIDGNKT